jgi:hypothetical protein
MNSPLETYLEELGQGLKVLPIHERLEQIDETRAHLEGLKESYEELGTESLEAEAQAIAQFGNAKSVAQELTKAHQPRPVLWQTLGVTAIFWMVANAITSLFLMTSQFFPMYNRELHGAMRWELSDLFLLDNSQITAKFGLFLAVLLPGLITGAICRAIAPRKTLRPMMVILAIYVLTLVVNALQMLLPAVSQGRIVSSTMYLPFIFPFQIVMMFLASGAVGEVGKLIQKVRRVLA